MNSRSAGCESTHRSTTRDGRDDPVACAEPPAHVLCSDQRLPDIFGVRDRWRHGGRHRPDPARLMLVDLPSSCRKVVSDGGAELDPTRGLCAHGRDALMRRMSLAAEPNVGRCVNHNPGCSAEGPTGRSGTDRRAVAMIQQLSSLRHDARRIVNGRWHRPLVLPFSHGFAAVAMYRFERGVLADVGVEVAGDPDPADAAVDADPAMGRIRDPLQGRHRSGSAHPPPVVGCRRFGRRHRRT